MKARYIISVIMLSAFTGTSMPIPAFAQTVVTQTAAVPDLDYSPMALFLKKFAVVERGRTKIAYSAARRQGKPFLNAYAERMAGEDISALPRDGQLAYWLNLQNLLVIKAITDDTKKNNLKKLRGTVSAPGKLWTKPRITIDGTALSIADIENKIIENWQDTPDLIYGLYQGVKGGPSLSRTSYTAANVRDELAKSAKLYVNARGIVKVEGQTAHVTPVFDWYKGGVFAASDRAVIEHIRSHAEPNLANKLRRTRELATVKLNYRADNYAPKKPKTDRKNRNVRIEPARRTGGYGS